MSQTPGSKTPSRAARLARNSCLPVIGIFFGFFLTEIYMRVSEKRPTENKVIDETRHLFEYDEVLGWKLKPGARARQAYGEFDVVYRTNKEGFRDDRDYSYEKQSGRKRAVVLGDSFAFGVGVENRETFAKLLEAETPYEVFNLGVSGYDPGQYLLLLKGTGLRYNPDLIVIALYLGNDISDLLLDHYSAGIWYKPFFVLEKEKLVVKNIPVPNKEPNVIKEHVEMNSFIRHIYWLRTLNLLRASWTKTVYPFIEKHGVVKDTDQAYALQLLEAILGDAQSICKSGGERRLVVLIIPSRNIRYNYRERWLGEEVAKMLKIHDIPYAEMLNGRREDFYFEHDGHFNARGHVFAADQLKGLFSK
jgi:hypothetical protein